MSGGPGGQAGDPGADLRAWWAGMWAQEAACLQASFIYLLCFQHRGRKMCGGLYQGGWRSPPKTQAYPGLSLGLWVTPVCSYTSPCIFPQPPSPAHTYSVSLLHLHSCGKALLLCRPHPGLGLRTLRVGGKRAVWGQERQASEGTRGSDLQLNGSFLRLQSLLAWGQSTGSWC